ncbi:hypothetical protein PSENEW3_00004356 [Picochlorum sp. SENEW3]|nr:hypothetical protein PSENEW3_00004356 [Picochlorum sp. SENEW3]
MGVKQYSLVKGYSVAIISLLSGAAVVHQIYKPDLVRDSIYHVMELRLINVYEYVQRIPVGAAAGEEQSAGPADGGQQE